MEMMNDPMLRKMVFLLGIIGICFVGYFLVLGPYLNRGEGDPYFVFTEVPAETTVNSTIIHLEGSRFLNTRGLDVKQENGKITAIFYRELENPEIDLWVLQGDYGSDLGDPSSRKYLEYRGVYYYVSLRIP
jgi:hypothetical protein